MNYTIQKNMISAKWNYGKGFYQSCLEDCQRQLALNAYDIEALTLMYMCEMELGLKMSAYSTLTLINKARARGEV